MSRNRTVGRSRQIMIVFMKFLQLHLFPDMYLIQCANGRGVYLIQQRLVTTYRERGEINTQFQLAGVTSSNAAAATGSSAWFSVYAGNY